MVLCYSAHGSCYLKGFDCYARYYFTTAIKEEIIEVPQKIGQPNNSKLNS